MRFLFVCLAMVAIWAAALSYTMSRGWIFGLFGVRTGAAVLGAVGFVVGLGLLALLGRVLRARHPDVLWILPMGMFIAAQVLGMEYDGRLVVLIHEIRWDPQAEAVVALARGSPGLSLAHARGNAKILVGVRARVAGTSNEILFGEPSVLRRSYLHLPLDLDHSTLRDAGSVEVPFRPNQYRHSPWWKNGAPPSEATLRMRIVYVAVADEDGELLSPIYEIPFKDSPEFRVSGAWLPQEGERDEK